MSLSGSRFDSFTGILMGTAVVATIAQPVPVFAKSAQEIAQLATQTTVEINNNFGISAVSGSGVIIAKRGNLYTVLTANHVVVSEALQYSIGTYLGKSYPIIKIQRLTKQYQDIDLALVQFLSVESYAVTPLGDSNGAMIGSSIFVSGYPVPIGIGIDRKLEFTTGIISSRLQYAPLGYTLRYQAVTRRGMSGGPVFDGEGMLVGIHGQGDTVGTITSPVTGQIEELKTGLNSAIPINSFNLLLSRRMAGNSDILSNLSVNRNVSLNQPFLTQEGFFCDTSRGMPTTVFQNSAGIREPWIRWTSDFFAISGYDPLTRCQQVTQRLERYRRNRQLNYVTVGLVNHEKAICTTSRVNGPCEGLIYTLRRDQDPIPTLYRFFAWLNARSDLPSLNESGSLPYIDVRDRLGILPK
jgi:serine protease Do